jgi:hypothetical protein
MHLFKILKLKLKNNYLSLTNLHSFDLNDDIFLGFPPFFKNTILNLFKLCTVKTNLHN